MKHIELIDKYVVDGYDLQYSDNIGRLTRCKDCEYADLKHNMCTAPERTTVPINENDYCSRGRLKEVG